MATETFRISVDTRPLLATMSDIGQRQVPYALSRGLNATALDWQAGQRNRFARAFTLRRPDFIRRLAKIEKFSSKRNLPVRFGIAGPRADLLTKFEHGGPKVTKSGSVALPVDARRTRGGIITAAQRPRELRNQAAAKRVFMITAKSGRRLLLQRTGKRKGGRVRVLYAFTPAARVRIPARLEFATFAAMIIRTRFVHNFQYALGQAMASASPPPTPNGFGS